MIGLGNPTLPTVPGQAPPFVPSGNPVWDEIQQAHSTLSPAAQRAVALSGVPQRAGEAEAGAAPLDAPPTEVAPQPLRQNLSEQSPQPLRPIASPSSLNVRGLGSPTPAPAAPPTPLAGTPATPLGQDPEAAAHLKTRDDAIRMGSGIHQIHNPFLRGLATVGDAVGSAVLPNVLRFIPGTSLHHRDVVAQNEGVVNEDVARAKTGAETAEVPARAEHERAEAEALRNPAPKEKPVGSTVVVGGKVMQFNPTSDRYDIEVGNAEKAAHEGLVQDKEGSIIGWTDTEGKHHSLDEPGTPPAIKSIAAAAKPKLAAGEEPLGGGRVEALNAALLDLHKKVDPKATELPPEWRLPANATQKDFDRVDKLLEHTERIGATTAQQQTATELRRQTHEMAERNQQDREEQSQTHWVSWTDPKSGRTVAGPMSQAKAAKAEYPAQVPTEEIRNITDARQVVRVIGKHGDEKSPESQGVLQLVDSLDKDGKLGIAASRLNSFLAGKVGTSPGDDPRIVTLLDKAKLAMTLSMKAHFGASGGRSPQMLQHFMEMANAKTMDATTLRAGFKAIKDYMEDRAMMADGQGQGGKDGGEQAIAVQLPDGRKGSIHPSQKDKFLKDNPGSKVVQ